jgi:cell division septal protein FtsQ
MRLIRKKKTGARHALFGMTLAALLPLAVSVIPMVVTFSGLAQAQGSVIRDIRVEGNRRLEPETVRPI